MDRLQLIQRYAVDLLHVRIEIPVKLKPVFLFLCMSFSLAALRAQPVQWLKKYVNNIVNDTTSAERPRFVAYPTLAYTPETSWEIGISSLLVYYANRDTTNRLSEISAFTFLTLEQQYGIWLDHAFYTDKSKWFFLGRARFQQFPLLYYGQGPDVSGEELAEIAGFSVAVRERFLRNVWDWCSCRN